jgi:hypothetical protein
MYLAVHAMYSKGGGRHGRYNSIEDQRNLSGISNLETQVYEHFQNRQFRAFTEATASLQTNQFRLLVQFTLLCRLPSFLKTTTCIELSAEDTKLFKELSEGIQSFDEAVKNPGHGRRGGGWDRGYYR